MAGDVEAGDGDVGSWDTELRLKFRMYERGSIE